MPSTNRLYEGRTIAFMDIGTNSVRLLLVRLNSNNTHTILSDQKEIVRNADLLGFDQTKIALMANAGLFHRKAMPRKKKHPSFGSLDKRSQRMVRLFALLLRIAESLDRSHTGVVQHAQFRQGEGSAMILDVRASRDCPLELWGVQTHRDIFKRILGKKLVTQAVVENSES